MSKVINKSLRGIRDNIPPGYFLGRTGTGKGPPVLLPLSMFTTPGYVANTTIQVGAAAGGDLGGTYPNPSVVKLNGNAVASTLPTDGQVLEWVAADSQWEPKTSSATASVPGLDKIVDRFPLDLLHDGVGAGGGSGTSWPYPVSAPAASGFSTIINGGSASPAPSVSDGTNGMIFQSGPTSSGDHIRAALKSVINASTFTVILGVIPNFYPANYRSIGLTITDGTKFYLLHVQSNTSILDLNVSRYTNLTTFSTNSKSLGGFTMGPVFFKIVGDGTNLTFYFSLDGVNFIELYTETLTNYLGTITKYGIGGDANSSTAAVVADTIYGTVFYWSESNP